MTLRSSAGSLVSYAYNHCFGRIPSRTVRHLFLKAYLRRFGNATGVQLGCSFLNGRNVVLGDRNVLNFGCLFDGRRFEVRLGNDVSIGPEATILTLGHDPQSSTFADKGGPVVVGDRAWIAYRAVILPNVTIGEGAIVAAGAIVTKDVAPFTIVAGNPARPIGSRNDKLEYRLNYRPWLI